MRLLIPASLPLLLLAAHAPAAAAPKTDDQAWNTLSLSAPLGGAWTGQVDLSARLSDDGRGLFQTVSQAMIRRSVARRITLLAGYAYYLNRSASHRTSFEQRPFEQISLDLGSVLGGSWAARTRFEQRFDSRGGDVGLRLREQLRYQLSLSKALVATAAEETFVALNDTDWGARHGIERQRVTLGLRHAFGRTLGLELGYLGQRNFRHAARDTIDHALTTTVYAGF